jgi:hypothetical protein
MKAIITKNRIEIKGYDLTLTEQPVECESEIKDGVLYIRLPLRKNKSEDDEFLKSLVESGLMKPEEAYKERHIRKESPLIKVKGKPLSQTIIEDRG